MKLAKAMFIVFEGLDGTGKSTCARALAESIGAKYMTTPAESLRKLRSQIIESFDHSQEAAQFFYLATVWDASKKIAALLQSGQSVVLDRYFVSTQAYAELRGSQFRDDSMQNFLTPADLTVFLHAPLEVRQQRIRKRGASTADNETLNHAADAKLHETHERRFDLPVVGQLITLDTSVLSVDEIVFHVIERIKNLK